MALSKALHFSQTGVQCHGRVIGVLSHVEVRSPPKLLLYHQGLLQQLGGTGEQGFGTDSELHQCKPVSLWKLQLPTCLPSSPPTPTSSWGIPKQAQSHTKHPRKGFGQHFHITEIVRSRNSAQFAPRHKPGLASLVSPPSRATECSPSSSPTPQAVPRVSYKTPSRLLLCCQVLSGSILAAGALLCHC